MTEKIQSLDINFHLLKEVDKPFIQNFTSGNIDLDNFFHNEVFICTKYAYITSYCVKEKGEIIALFTLSNDSASSTRRMYLPINIVSGFDDGD